MLFFFVASRAMRHASAAAVEPSYIEAFATSIPVRRTMSDWNS